MKNLFKKSMALLLAVALCLGTMVGAFTVSAAEGDGINLRVNFLIREKLGYSFYPTGDELANYDKVELEVTYNYYGQGVSQEATSASLKPVSSIETGKNYVIANTTTGTVLTNTVEIGSHWYSDLTSESHVLLGSTPTVNSDKWSFVTYDDGYAMAFPDGSGYLSPNTVNAHKAEMYTTTSPVYVKYDSTKSAFQIYREDGEKQYKLVACHGIGDSNYIYAIGCATQDFDSYSYWNIYEVVEGTEATVATNYDRTSKTVTYTYTDGAVFEYTEIAAYEMMLDTTFTLKCYTGNTVAVEKSGTITFADHVKRTLSSAADKTVYVDMLNYGAAAQDYFASQNAGSDLATDTAELGLPNADIADYQQYATSDDIACIANASTEDNTSTSNGAQLGATMQILSSNRLVFVVNPGQYNVANLKLVVGDLELAVSDLELVGSYYYYYPAEKDAIPLYDVEKVISATLYNGTSVVATKTYSIEAFAAANMKDGAKLEALGDALLKLSASTRVLLGLDENETPDTPVDPEPEEPKPTLQAVTSIEANKNYIIVNKSTGKVWTTDYDSSNYVFALGGEASVNTTDFWQFNSNATALSVVNDDGTTTGYYRPNSSSGFRVQPITKVTSTDLTTTYNSSEEAWLIYRTSSRNAYYFAADADDNVVTSLSVRSGNTVSSECYWIIYEIVNGSSTPDTPVDPEPEDPDTPVDPEPEDPDTPVTPKPEVPENATLKAVTSITAGKTYVIVNTVTGTVLTTTLETGAHWYSDLGEQNHLLLGGTPTVNSDQWKVVSSGSAYALAPTGASGYLSPNTVNVHFDGSVKTLSIVYNSSQGGFQIYREEDGSQYKLVACHGVNNTNYIYAIGCLDSSFDTYSYWKFYEVVEGSADDGGDDSGSTLTNIQLSSSLESISTKTTYDALPAISSASALLTSASQATNEGAKFVSNTTETTNAINLLREETDKRIAEIRGSENLTIPSNAKVYYVSNSGSDSNNGTSSSTPWASLDKVNSISAGSSSRPVYVLFERGGTWRGQITAKGYVTYSAYGTGDKPKIFRSTLNAGGSGNSGAWTKYSTNIWVLKSSKLGDDIGTVVFNDGDAHAIKMTSTSELRSDLYFYHDANNGALYLYSTQNPAERFGSIEFNMYGHAITVKSSNVTIDNLCIKYTGSHGVGAGSYSNLTVKNCEFGWIGGSYHSPGSSDDTRYGNAIEIYGTCSNFYAMNNYIYQVYDAGITQQITLSKSGSHKNILYSGNVIEHCNYSVEYWITSTDSIDGYIDTFLIEDNYMWYAGRGFCEQRPDTGNGSHINGWRFHDQNRATNFAIRNNVLVDSKDVMINVHSNRYNSDGSDSMPIFNNNIILAKSSTGLGVIEQCADSSHTSWPSTVSFNNRMFSSIDALLYGDIFGHISSSLYSNNNPTF